MRSGWGWGGGGGSKRREGSGGRDWNVKREKIIFKKIIKKEEILQDGNCIVKTPKSF